MNEKRQIKFNKLLDLYKDKLIKFISDNKLDDSPDYILNCILSADPDIIGKNSKWLINNTLNGNILWEDIEAGENSKSYDTLNRFLTIRNQFDNDKLRDINQFKRLGDIAQQLRGYEVIQSNKSIKSEEKQQIYSETEFLYDKNNYLVISPLTEKSSCFWGLGTEWCTASTHSENYFDYYNNHSPLYICITPDGKKYQFHKNSSPMDENDNPINNITNPILRKLALFTGQIYNLKEINYKDKIESKITCYRDGSYIQFIDKDSPYYEECCKLAVQQNGGSIKYIDKDLPYYEECCRLAVQQDGRVIQYIDKDLPCYEECCKLSCKQDGLAIQYIDKSLPYYEELCKLAVQQNGWSIQYADKNLPYYEECCELMVKKDAKAIKLIDKNLSNYEECCKLAVQQNGDVIKYIDKKLPYYKDLLKLSKQNIKKEVVIKTPKEEVLKENIKHNFCEIKELLINTEIRDIKKYKELSINK